MNAHQFYQYIENPEKLGIHEEVQLRGVMKEYPYFQSAQLLLSKCLKNMDNYTFEKQLRTAAIYAPNRAVLYQLLKSNKERTIAPKPLTEEAHQSPQSTPDDELPNQYTSAEKTEPILTLRQPILEAIAAETEAEIRPVTEIVNPNSTDLKEEAPIITDTKAEEVLATVAQENKDEETTLLEIEATLSPLSENLKIEESIIPEPMERDQLSEKRDEIAEKYAAFLARKKALEGSTFNIANPVSHDVPGIKEADKPANDEQQALEAVNEVDGHNSAPGYIEGALEEIKAEPSQPESELLDSQPKSTDHSFSEWLRMSSYRAVNPSDSIHEESGDSSADLEPQSLEESIDVDQILDRFINLNPTISRPKAEFFNPLKAAQKSLEDNDDLVTETLARMYERQGNFHKAISIYEKLSLKYPEKSEIFAAHILELQNKIN